MYQALEFRGHRRFMSNFYPCEVLGYPTAEHAFQAYKCVSDEDRALIARAATPGIAKRLGRQVLIRPDWEQVKVQVMEHVVHEKFTKHMDLRVQLRQVPDLTIVEWNTWHDMVWGQCWCAHHRHQLGSNHLGLILTRLRASI